nr:G protein-coupled receptor [Proales similis]
MDFILREKNRHVIIIWVILSLLLYWNRAEKCVVIDGLHDFNAYCYEVELKDINMHYFSLKHNISKISTLGSLSIQSQSKRLSLSNKLSLQSFRFKDEFSINWSGFRSISLDFKLESIWDFTEPVQKEIIASYYYQYSNFQLEGKNDLPCELSILMNITFNAVEAKLRGEFFLFYAVKYYENTCSVIFSQANIEHLYINGLVNSLVERNILGFQDLTDRGTVVKLNHKIHGFQLRNVYRVRLSTSLFSLQVFNTENLMHSVFIDGIVNEVEPELFRFVDAHHYELNLKNLRQFLVNNPKWIVNIGLKHSSVHIYFEQHNLENQYGFPSVIDTFDKYGFDDEDFCAFRYYPVEDTRIKFRFSRLKINQTTCTIQFLSRSKCLDESPMNEQNKSICCNTTEMLERCDIQDITQTSSRVDKFTSIYDHIFRIELAKFIFAILLHPIACLLGFLFNCLSAWVIKQMNKDGGRGKHQGQKNAADRQEKLFGYFFFNALFSAGFCLVSVPELLTRCVRFNGIYCSPFIATDWVRVYYLAGIVLVGNVCKLGANLTQCSFTLYRFFINTDDGKSKWRSKFLKARPRNVASVFLFISIILTIPQLFFNEGYTIKSVLNLIGFDFFLYNHHSASYFEKNPAFVVMYVVNLLFNEVLSTCFNLVVDLKLLSFVRAVARNQKSLASAHKNKEKEEVEKRLSKMIIFNGIVNILLKTPQMVVSSVKTWEFLSKMLTFLYFFNLSDYLPSSWCMFEYSYFDSICLNLLSIAQSLAILTYSVNFILFLLFNQNYKRTIKTLFFSN